MPHLSPLIVHGKPVADTLPWFHPGKVPLHSSLILRADASPVHNRRELNVSIDVVPSGVRYVLDTGAASISQTKLTNCCAGSL
jgi:hypothetical protein